MTVLLRDSMTARLIAVLLATMFLAGCPDSATTDQVALEIQFHEGKSGAYPAVICTCSTGTADGSIDFSSNFRIDTKSEGNSDKGLVLGEGNRFTASFSSTGDGDSFTATIVIVNTNQTQLVAKSDFTSISVARDGVTIPHDSALPAGKYTVTLTGKTPQPPAGEPQDNGSEG